MLRVLYPLSLQFFLPFRHTVAGYNVSRIGAGLAGRIFRGRRSYSSVWTSAKFGAGITIPRGCSACFFPVFIRSAGGDPSFAGRKTSASRAWFGRLVRAFSPFFCKNLWENEYFDIYLHSQNGDAAELFSKPSAEYSSIAQLVRAPDC